jgi:sulfur-oxidizing protein SoxA
LSTRATLAGAIALAAAVATTSALAQGTSTQDEIEKYRQALQDGNPAELWEARGEGLWKTARGPKKATLEKCDLGKGPGVVAGAYAAMPRFFADAGRVMDLETRLVWCMTTLQGLTDAEAKRNVFGNPGVRSDMEALVAFVTAESKGVPMNVRLDNAAMREAYALGEKIFFFRGGPHDFSCATCHAEDGKRIRLQDLPNLTKKEGAQRGYTTWPAYRVSQGELRSFQWRLYDCFRQQRFPELEFASPASVALTTFLAYNANGAKFAAPAIKR